MQQQTIEAIHSCAELPNDCARVGAAPRRQKHGASLASSLMEDKSWQLGNSRVQSGCDLATETQLSESAQTTILSNPKEQSGRGTDSAEFAARCHSEPVVSPGLRVGEHTTARPCSQVEARPSRRRHSTWRMIEKVTRLLASHTRWLGYDKLGVLREPPAPTKCAAHLPDSGYLIRGLAGGKLRSFDVTEPSLPGTSL